jgi:sortase (surface protein transpeptidase)
MTPFIPTYAYDVPPFPVSFVAEEIAEIAPQKVRTRTQKIALFLAACGLIFLVVSFGPSLYYSLKGSDRIATLLRGTVSAEELPLERKYSYQPTFDANLPVTNSISIPSVKIKTEIEEAIDQSYEDALRKGVWRVNDFGTPYNRESPTILAAHRFGYLNWSLDFRLHNSFYNLPKVETGDVVEVVWRQRKYVYGVYKKEESKEITDYNADLILYTCEDLTSDMRVIVYAKLLDI